MALKSRALTNDVQSAQSHVSSITDDCTVLGLEKFGNEKPLPEPNHLQILVMAETVMSATTGRLAHGQGQQEGASREG